ncbi:non-ribosomal peptide synthetase-like protein [Dinothrombium tinctorium]|uniref:Non-ribosomal peptide synthetase-like protein n=1 Tax=Dinothrombium tinctorium TaxID=1965070 RepID=A0A3S3NR89_9ACAR|nr:non-ribosomal peptide synthetase-like protein [Dinothrombium tinctorium]RWS00272.1 non-ribosomal peptide synthetase-like protein [Dinothrombium tinctorium]
MRMVLVGADAFYLNTFRRLEEKLGSDIILVNGYGLTEAAIASILFTEKIKYVTSSGLVPIGRSIIGLDVYIVDPSTHMLSPIGTAGEICLCGETIGKGDVPTTTLNLNGNQPVMLTGDTARMLPDGNIDYIGRANASFFKIHGFRVNPLEIEHCVIKHLEDRIDDVRVFATEKGYEQKIICLCYKAKNKENMLDAQIRSIIKNHLPYYMNPGIVKSVGEIPMTINGKTNIKLLKEICLQEKTMNQTFKEITSAMRRLKP